MWLTGGALLLALGMILGLITLLLVGGLSTLWPKPVVRIQCRDGRVRMGEIARRETARGPDGRPVRRRLIRIGNFELTHEHFIWIADEEVVSEDRPPDAMVFERVAWGRFYGLPRALVAEGRVIATNAAEIRSAWATIHPDVVARRRRRERLETVDIGEVNRRQEAARLRARAVELEEGRDSARFAAAQREAERVERAAAEEYARLRAEIDALNAHNARFHLDVVTADGREVRLMLADIVRMVPANALSLAERWAVYASRWWEFVSDVPREANSEGGVFPAIFGTVVMTLLMSLAVVPVGVMAALYLREYAKPGPWVSVIRISINNLAGVPSIVFGVFGLGFFCYLIGATLDELLFAARLPNPTFGKGGILWASLTLAVMTLPVVIVATEEALAAVPNSMREGSFACGASKWQTLRRIVLPRALPGILTGMILAMARGAGEVAPLMLVGAVKLAPELPVDRVPPFIHPERSFMHLGFHIYDLGFQSQNSEAAKPMVFTTALLLVTIIVLLNLLAISIRNYLRRKHRSDVF
ncbi:MAG: phosphate ABC transporter permease PstA [Kiritimatiellae bacterium]|nr:phosphate ABC transporter permease PstA [Kiritimatiellia bacterium]